MRYFLFILTSARYILLKARLCALYPKKPNYDVLETYLGKDLVGLTYTPLFDYFVEQFREKAFRVVSDNYVTAESGTGIVHQAPGFGEDDFRVCVSSGIATNVNVPCPIDANGRFTNEVPDFQGVYVKDADKDLIQAIKTKGR